MQIPSSVFWRGHTSLGELSLLLKVALLGSQLRIGRVVQLVTCAIVGGAPHQHEVQVPLPYGKSPLSSRPSKLAPRGLQRIVGGVLFDVVGRLRWGSDLRRDFPQTVRCPRQHCHQRPRVRLQSLQRPTVGCRGLQPLAIVGIFDVDVRVSSSRLRLIGGWRGLQRIVGGVLFDVIGRLRCSSGCQCNHRHEGVCGPERP